jgi:hypothetical protein
LFAIFYLLSSKTPKPLISDCYIEVFFISDLLLKKLAIGAKKVVSNLGVSIFLTATFGAYVPSSFDIKAEIDREVLEGSSEEITEELS